MLARIGSVAMLLLFGLMIALNVRGLLGVLGIATTARNFGSALVPAGSSFSDPKVTIMIIVGAIVCLVVSFLAAGWLRRRST